MAAWFIDRFDRKTTMLVLYVAVLPSALCAAAAPNYLFLVAEARIVTGGFGGVVNATVLTIVGDLFPDKAAVVEQWASSCQRFRWRPSRASPLA